MGKIRLIRTGNDDPGFLELIRMLDDEMASRYGEIQKQFNQQNKVDKIRNVVVAFNESEPVGCGSFRMFGPETAELKRMYLKPEFRGSGIAQNILGELEKWALECGYSKIVLETGTGQPEAIRFYQKNGYERMENYGPYIGSIHNVCMFKQLLKSKHD